jgi:hypothetical protein
VISESRVICPDTDMLPTGTYRVIDGRLYRTMDYKTLLVKYVAHVAAAEGSSFATDYYRMSPCNLLEHEYSVEEAEVLEKEIFPLAL